MAGCKNPVSPNEGDRVRVFFVCNFSCVLWKFFGFLSDLFGWSFQYLYFTKQTIWECSCTRPAWAEHRLQSQCAMTLWSAQVTSMNVKVWCELGTLIMDFLCCQWVVSLLPYRDATERKACGQREEERRSDDTHFSSLSLSAADLVQSSAQRDKDKLIFVSQPMQTVTLKEVWLQWPFLAYLSVSKLLF